MKDDTSFIDGIMKIATEYYALYTRDREGTIEFLKKSLSPVSVLNELYVYVVNRNQLTRIEHLPTERKQKYWDEVKHLNLNQTQKIKICRAMYVLEMIGVEPKEVEPKV
jgi:hypothetical protein